MFASYMHAKHLKSLEKFREIDKKLIDELRNIDKIVAVDVELDQNAYINIFEIL